MARFKREALELNPFCINSLAPGRFEWNLEKVIFKLISMINGWGIFCKIAIIWMQLDLTHDKTILVQVMAWCHQATSHYLGQCWPSSLSPHGITRPQWVKAAMCTTYTTIVCILEKSDKFITEQHWVCFTNTIWVMLLWYTVNCNTVKSLI